MSEISARKMTSYGIREIFIFLLSFVLVFGSKECPFSLEKYPCNSFPSGPSQYNESFIDDSGKFGRPLPLKDIKVVAAFGDSVMTGLFMRGTRSTAFRYLFDLPTEDRGFVFAIGGKSGAISIANYMIEMQPKRDLNIVGQSIDRTDFDTVSSDLPTFQLNLAESGSAAEDINGQVDVFITRMKSSAFDKYRNEWKMLTIFVGGIDLCRSCLDETAIRSPFDPNKRISKSSAEYFTYSVNKTIRNLYDNVPRDSSNGKRNVFLNIYSLFRNISQIYEETKDQTWCRRVQEIAGFCECLYKSDESRLKMDTLTEEYNEALFLIVRQWQSWLRVNQISDFRISLVRTFEKLSAKQLGSAYLSETDW